MANENGARARVGRRRALQALGGGAALAAGAAAGFGASTYDDRAASRSRANGASGVNGSSVRSVQVLWRAETTRKVMALSFDDGPGDTLTRPLLEVLRQADVRATFSLVGQQAARLRDIVREQIDDGHELANHSWTHPDLSLLSPEAMSRQLDRTDELLGGLMGARPHFIRPPYGRVSGALLQHAAMHGQDVLLWDVRFHETEHDSDGNIDYVMEHMGPGSILLGHDAGKQTRYVGTQAVPGLIREAKARGYEFVTASTMAELDRPRPSTT